MSPCRTATTDPATTGQPIHDDTIPSGYDDGMDHIGLAHHTTTGLSNTKLAMWMFLGSECLLFGGLISTYMLYRNRQGDALGPDQLWDIPFTSATSFVLLMSSLTMVLAVTSAQRKDDRRQGPTSTGEQSVVETQFLRMTLDHDTGEMTGLVLAGRFAGLAFDELSQAQLFELLNDFSGEDDESAALLRAYLDRTYGSDWQEVPQGDGNPEGLSGEMTRSDAYAILGLEEGANTEQIIAAHGRLIQRLHPDRGGSTFLAAKINQTRDLLLGA